MKQLYFVFCMSAFCFLLFTCKINTNGIALVTGDYVPPKLIALDVCSETEIQLAFSKPVSPVSMRVENRDSSNSVQAESGRDTAGHNSAFAGIIFSDEKTENLVITLNKAGEIGKTYTLHGCVEDQNGNTLTFLTEFSAYNPRVPKLVLSEVRTAYAKPKVEFIELYAQTSGNLAGVCVYNSYNGAECRYEFPPAEVAEGEYIVLHLRTIEEGTVDEINAVDVSQGTDAVPYSRDFWEENTSSRLSKTCVILLEERKNGNLLDALLLAESKYEQWHKPQHAHAAKYAFDSGVWGGGFTPDYAVAGDATTATRTFSRQGDLQNAGTASKNDWIIVASSNATPGKENSSKPYVKK